MASRASTERFTGRADVYDTYRPGYPPEILSPLREAYGLSPSHVVADVGSGTGRLTEVFLANGNTVFAIEPNHDMRTRAEVRLRRWPGFRSVNGTAEATGLAEASADVVAAGQAFHWFDADRAAREFRRILRPGSFVVLIWNVRDPGGSPFQPAYEGFLREYSLDYDQVRHGRLTEGDALARFFTGGHAEDSFPNPRTLDFDAVWGGYRSASYSLPPEHPRYEEALGRLRAVFQQHQVNGVVSMPLRTVVYHGRI
jgi:SAM-dependent methyltransferase